MQRVFVFATVAMAVVGLVAAANAPSDSLAYKQESPDFVASSSVSSLSMDGVASVPVTSFVEVEGGGMRSKALSMAIKFVADMRAALKTIYPAKGALSAAAKATGGEFDKNFRRECKKVAPSVKMCPNFITIVRLSFGGENPFSKANTERFEDSVTDIILRWVQAWRLQHPKRSRRQRGNPWSAANREEANVDPMANVRLSTGVRGGLNTFGRLNTDKANPKLNLAKPKNRYPLGSATDQTGPYKSPQHVSDLNVQVRNDLLFLREKVYQQIRDKKFNRMIGNRDRAHKAIRTTRRICDRERRNRVFAPTFCRAIEYLASVNFVGRNYFKNLKDFAALTASFMQHNHKQTSRYGYHIMRRPNYHQDVTVVSVKLALHLRPSKFNLRSFSREFNNMLSNVLATPRSRIRIASVKFGKRINNKRSRARPWNRRRHVRVTFEFLPKKGDKRIRSRPAESTSVDALAEQFYAMAKDRPTSPFYKVPILSRILPRSIILSKTLGRRPAKLAGAVNVQSANTPRFAEAGQSIVTEVAVTSEETETSEAESEAQDTAATHDDAEIVELEQSDEEFTESDEAVDGMDSEMTSDEEAEAEAEAEAEEEEAIDEQSLNASVEDAELEQLEEEEAEATMEEENEVMLQVAQTVQMHDTVAIDVATESQALHLSEEAATTESTGEAEEAEAAAAEEAEAEAADAPESFAEVESTTHTTSESANELSVDAEDAAVEEIDAWEAAQHASTEQVVADESDESESDESVESEDELTGGDADSSEDESDESDESDSDSDESAESAALADAESAEARASDLSNGDAPTAAEPLFGALPEVNALPDLDADIQEAKAAAHGADGAVFLQTDIELTAASSRSVPTAIVFVVAILVSIIAALH